MKTTGQIIGESDGDYRKYLQKLVLGQKLFIEELEKISEQRPNIAQELSEVIAENVEVLKEYQERLKGELNRALSSKKD